MSDSETAQKVFEALQPAGNRKRASNFGKHHDYFVDALPEI
jgi:hypothetical protein